MEVTLNHTNHLLPLISLPILLFSKPYTQVYRIRADGFQEGRYNIDYQILKNWHRIRLIRTVDNLIRYAPKLYQDGDPVPAQEPGI